MPSAVHAINMGEALASILGGLVGIMVWIGGNLLIGIIFLVVWVAQYNDFITSPAVTMGWVIIRDICNMFFIVILLIIAFATVLNIEKYSWKHLLPKLLIMAVLINFSKLICGVLIDFAQVVMLTFVNGFRDIAAGNFAEMAGIHGLLNVPSNNESVSFLSVAGTYILALLYIIFSVIIMGVVLCVLVIRMIMLWILVVLSPFAYLLETTPSTKAYAGKWWSYFASNLVSGPLLAFFIWLSFAATQSTASGALQGFENNRPDGGAEEGRVSQLAEQRAGLASAGTPEGMLKFVISMGLLIGGLMMTKEIGGAAGAIAGKGLGAMSGTAKKLTGYNAVTGRVAAFNKKRDAARTEKYSAFGEKMYGQSLRAKGAIKGGAAAAWAATKTGLGAVRSGAAQGTRSMVGPYGGLTLAAQAGIPGFNLLAKAMDKLAATLEKDKTGKESKEDKIKKKAEAKDQHDRLLGAYATGTYTDKFDNKFTKPQELSNGVTVYTEPLKDDKGIEYAHLIATDERRVQLDNNGNEMKDEKGKTIYQDALLEKTERKDENGDIVKDKKGNIIYDEKIVYRNKMLDGEGKIAKDKDGRIVYEQRQKPKLNDSGTPMVSRFDPDKPLMEAIPDERVDVNQHAIKKMGKLEYSVDSAWTKSMVTAKAFNNQKEEKKVTEESKKMADAGMSEAQLLGVLQNASMSDHKRMGAAIELAIKQGFKGKDARQQVDMAKSLFKGHDNNLLTKKFNDEVDKKQAYLNYDVSTDEGERKMMKRFQGGKMEVQSDEAYKDPNFIRALAHNLTADEFKNTMKKVSAYSSKHNDSSKEGYRAFLDEQKPVFKKDGTLDDSRKVFKDITKDLRDVGRGSSVTTENIGKVLESAIGSMSATEIGKLDIKSFKGDAKILGSQAKADTYTTELESILSKMKRSERKKILGNRDANKETLEALKVIWAKNPTTKEDEKNEEI